MKLSTFITTRIEQIIDEWESFARTFGPVADAMTTLALKDHAKGILQAIAFDIGTSQNSTEQLEKSQDLTPGDDTTDSAASLHGTLRQASDFSLLQLSAEYRALRATVLRLWLPEVGTMSSTTVYEMIRFNEAIDQALAESIVTYSAKADQTRELFLAILGHDLRAPLATLSLAGDLLKMESGGREKLGQIGERVRRSSRMMAIMVDDLIGYTRTHLGSGMPVAPEQVDVDEVCQASIEDANATYPSTNFSFSSTGNMTGYFDRVRLHQLFTNLLVNAAQYGQKHRTVTMTTTSSEEYLVVQVQNFGVPIAESDLASVFKPLVQLTIEDEMDTRPKTSLGLGLFVAKEIAAAHGGKICVSSNEENGTVFTVTLPRGVPLLT
ncbi:MAG: two-component sensor histidine kinase [Herminiimonas sp.]|nr:two-component sensor histidine kinase [Herminiimonas sp.]